MLCTRSRMVLRRNLRIIYTWLKRRAMLRNIYDNYIGIVYYTLAYDGKQSLGVNLAES